MIDANSLRLDPVTQIERGMVKEHLLTVVVECFQRIFHFITETLLKINTEYSYKLHTSHSLNLHVYLNQMYRVIQTKLYKVNYLSNVNTIGRLKV